MISKNLLENKVRRIVRNLLNEDFREVKVHFDNGDSLTTSMNPKLTDEQIYGYYAVGKSFNIGAAGKDKLTKVKKVEILK